MSSRPTALIRGATLAAVLATAFAGAVLAAPTASALPAAELAARTAPTADAVWLAANGTLYNQPSPTVNTYGSASKTSVPLVSAGAFVKVADVQIAITSAWQAGVGYTLSLPDGVKFAAAPSVSWTKQPVDVSALEHITGVAGTNSTAAPAATGVTVVDAATPTAQLDAGNDTADISFTADAPSPSSGTIGANAGYLLTLTNIRLAIAPASSVAAQGGAVNVAVAAQGSAAAPAATTVAYIAPVATSARSATTGRAFNGTVTLPDISITELAPNAFSNGTYTLKLSTSQQPPTGTSSISGDVRFTMSKDAGVIAPPSANASGTTLTAVLGGTDDPSTRGTLTISGVKVVNVPDGATVQLNLTSPTVPSAHGVSFTQVADWEAAPVTVATTDELPRIAGSNRYATARLAAEQFASGGSVDAVILANGTDGKNGADALAANFLAGAVSAPILLTDGSGTLPVDTQYALLNATRGAGDDVTVYVMGKTDSVSQEARTRAVSLLKSAGHARANVVEVAGANRYATSAAAIATAGASKIAAQPVKSGATYLPTAFLASGVVNADALAAGSVSFSAHVPVLLTGRDSLPAEVAQVIRNSGIRQVIALGGTDRVSDEVLDSLAAAGVISVARISGVDRFDTAAQIADWGWKVAGITGTRVLLANGVTGWPDALAAGPVAGRTGGAVLTVSKGSLGSSTVAFLQAHKVDLVDGVTALGSSAGSVSDSVVTSALNALR